MKDCIFCKIVKEEIPSKKVYEDKYALAFLDIKPINPGHTLIVPKKHFETINDMSPTDLANLMPAVNKVGKAILKLTEGLVISQRNFRAAGQVVDHVHFHLIPRHEGDGHEDWHPQRDISEKENEEFLKRIKKYI